MCDEGSHYCSGCCSLQHSGKLCSSCCACSFLQMQAVELPDLVLVAQVRGMATIRAFSKNLMEPYRPAGESRSSSRMQELEAEVAQLRSQVEDLQRQLSGHSPAASEPS